VITCVQKKKILDNTITRQYWIWCSWDCAWWYISVVKPTICKTFQVHWISLYMFQMVFPSKTCRMIFIKLEKLCI